MVVIQSTRAGACIGTRQFSARPWCRGRVVLRGRVVWRGPMARNGSVGTPNKTGRSKTRPQANWSMIQRTIRRTDRSMSRTVRLNGWTDAPSESLHHATKMVANLAGSTSSISGAKEISKRTDTEASTLHVYIFTSLLEASVWCWLTVAAPNLSAGDLRTSRLKGNAKWSRTVKVKSMLCLARLLQTRP